MSIPIPPELRGYISELQAQVSVLSDRAAGLAGQLATARQVNEEQAARIAGYERQMASQDAESTGEAMPDAT